MAKGIELKLDELVKKMVKERDNYTDQKSGERVEGSNCHWSHVIPISHCKRLRWDMNNSIVLSYHNHINWWHKHPIAALEWFKNKFPERYKYLKEKEIEYAKMGSFKEHEKEELYNRLKELNAINNCSLV